MDTAQINFILSVFSVIGQISLIFLFASLFIKRGNKISAYISENALVFAFVVSLVATLGSLYYSEIAGIAPCSLCWYQRIFMYPQVILLGMALYKKNNLIFDYSLALVVVGALISAYHNYIIYAVRSGDTCGLVSCTQKYIIGFGYLTLPLMALTAFLLIGTLLLIKRRTMTND